MKGKGKTGERETEKGRETKEEKFRQLCKWENKNQIKEDVYKETKQNKKTARLRCDESDQTQKSDSCKAIPHKIRPQ